MVAYIPTDNTQSTAGAKAALATQVKEYLSHGPPPPNYYTARGSGGKYMIYADHNVNNSTNLSSGGTKLHPCSDAGIKGNPSPTFSPELTFSRRTSLGFFDPPMQYAAPQVIWRHYPDGWESALAAAMTEKGMTTTADQIKAKYKELVEHPENKKEQTHVLYHPADRDTAVFKGESGASLVARLYAPGRAFSLIVVCPLVRADGIGWERIYDTINRPPIYARWSTGEQANREPLVLMCFPKPESFKGRESYYKDVEWFTMKPRPNSSFETLWRNMWKSYGPEDIAALAKSFNFPNKGYKQLSWALVLVHRMIAVGEKISDSEIGSWIQQYGSYLAACGMPYKPEGRTFTFNAKKPYSGRQITYRELTGLILNPRFGSGLHFQFVQRFDDALDALINYNLDRTDAKWSAFREKMLAAQKVPW